MLNIKLSAYYYRKNNPIKFNVEKETDVVVKMFKKHFGNFGRRTIRKQLLAENISISERKISKILKMQGLHSKYGRKKGKNVYTSPQTNEKYISENLYANLSENEKKQNKILSMDFTEQNVNGKKIYSCGAINVNDKVLEALISGCKNDSKAACSAVENAIKQFGVPDMIMTDRGSPFVSKSFHDLLESYGIKHSMSRPHTPADNCFIETFWKSMKTEIGYVNNLNREQYLLLTEFYMYYYNCERPHSTLGYCAPLKALHKTVI